MKSSRIRKLTPKAMELYQQSVAEFNVKFESICDSVNLYVQECDNVSSETPGHILQNIHRTLPGDFEQLKHVYTEFSQYLIQTGTEDSNSENLSITRKYTSINESVDACLNKLNSLLEKITERATPSSVTPSVSETKSVKSHASSKGSKTSTMIARKLAKAEAARAKFEYSEKEALLKLQQTQLEEQQQIAAAATACKKSELEEQQQISAAAAARKKSELDIQLNLIEQKKEIAAAQAEAEVLESSLSSQGSVISARFRLPRSDPNVRTADFVASKTPLNVTENIVPLSVSAPDFVPQQIQPPVMNTPYTPANLSNHDSSANLVSDFSNFLLKKDLLLTRLSVFSDRPENYMVWKNSFKNIMSE